MRALWLALRIREPQARLRLLDDWMSHEKLFTVQQTAT